MKGLWKTALAILVVAACGRDGAITAPEAPSALPPTSGVLALGVDSTTGASIETNKDDYTPGEVVHLVGRGWGPGETVNLHMTEEPNTHADVDTNVVADAAGGFSIHFYDVQIHDLGVTFTLTATGVTSHSVAVATFTDGNVGVKSAPSGVPTFSTGAFVKYNQSISCGTGTTTSGAFTVNTSAFTVVTGINANNSIKLTVPGTLTGYVFESWTVPSPGIVVSGSLTNPSNLCIRVANSNDQPDVTVNYNTIPVANPGGPYSVNEATAISLNASGSTDSDGTIASYAWTYSVVTADAGAGCIITNPNTNSPSNTSITCNDDGSYSVSLTVTDNDGASSTPVSATLTVNNVAPTAVISAPSSVGTGTNFTVSLGSPNDVSSNDVTAGFTYAFDCGAGYNAFSATASRTCTAGGVGTQTVKGKIQDKDGDVTEYTAQVSVVNTNVPPTVDAGGAYSGAEGSAISLGGLNGATATDPDVGDVLTYKWTVNTTGIDAGGTCAFSPSDVVLNPSVTCTDDSDGAAGSKFTLTLEVKDGVGGHTVTDNADLTVTNANPVANAGSAKSGAEGASIALNGSGDDPGDNDDAGLTYLWTVNSTGIDAGGTCTLTNATLPNASVTCTDDSNGGNFTVSLKVSDDDGGMHTATVNLSVSNANPTATATGGSGAEGSAIQLSGSGDDPGNNDDAGLTYAWTVITTGIDAGGACNLSSTTAQNPTVTCTDDGNFTVSLVVSDDDGGSSVASTANLTVTNALPVVTITSPTIATNLFSLLNGAVPVTATYTDAGGNDSHQCQLELVGDIGTVGSYFAVTGGNCSGSILPVQADVYNLIVRVRDDDGGVGTASIMIVVYDPSAGFVTGGGWVQSAPGAYKLDALLGGKATFGFVSKYKKGATVPEGNTEFQFHAGGMNFSSSTYQFLIVNQAGTNAQFKGTGTINGAGSYTFTIWATDNGNSGDTFRILITNNNGGATVYDNGVEQTLGGGSIVIHTGGRK